MFCSLFRFLGVLKKEAGAVFRGKGSCSGTRSFGRRGGCPGLLVDFLDF